MAKLVLLSPGMAGRTHELKGDKITVGRVEDNLFQIAEPSVSSHHCEILLQGSDVVVKDLNSTNGTFINGDKITETVLKPGQVLRLGQIEMRLETDGPPGAAAPASSAPATKKPGDQSLHTQRGVSLTDLEQSARGGAYDTATTKGFTKKDNKGNRIFWILAGVFGVVIAGLLIYVFAIASK